MSVVIKYGEAISRSPLNNSKAHQMYSFPKAERFPKIKTFGHADTFYNLPPVLSKRKTTFGFGNKSDFTKKDKNISSRFYQTVRDFDQGSKLGKYYSFGQPREKYGKVYIEGHKNVDKDVPGPGKYFLPKPFGWDAPKFTMKGKNDDNKTKNRNYQKNEEERKKNDEKYMEIELSHGIPLEMNNKGKYPVSTIRNINSFYYGNDKSQRSGYALNKFPGPGKYDSTQLLGRIFNSKYKTNDGFSMGERHYVKDSRHNYPGPGSYALPSDFGIYQSKYADKYPKENVYPEPKHEQEDKRPWRHNMKKVDPEELRRRKELYLGEYYLDDDDDDDDKNKKDEKPENNELYYKEKEEQENIKPKDEAEQVGKTEEKPKDENEGIEKAEEGKVEEGKVEEGKVEEGKVEEGKVEEGKVEEGKVEEEKVEEEKVEEEKVEEGKVEEEKVEEGKVEEGKVEEEKDNNDNENHEEDIEKIKKENEKENGSEENQKEENNENEDNGENIEQFMDDEEQDEVKPQDEAAKGS